MGNKDKGGDISKIAERAMRAKARRGEGGRSGRCVCIRLGNEMEFKQSLFFILFFAVFSLCQDFSEFEGEKGKGRGIRIRRLLEYLSFFSFFLF